MGGYDGSNTLNSVKLFTQSLSDACSIPALPQPRSHHSLSILSGGRLVACGGRSDGNNYFDSCLSWVAGNGSWTQVFTIRHVRYSNFIIIKIHLNSVKRYSHTAWTPPSLPDSIVLLGGYAPYRPTTALTAEIVPGVSIEKRTKSAEDRVQVEMKPVNAWRYEFLQSVM